jgi:hypothetical protein
MNKSVIVAIVVIAAIVVGVPLIAKVMQSSNSSSGSTDSAGSETGASDSLSATPAAIVAPALDANSLSNTQWAIKFDKITLTVTFLPGGVLQAQSPMLKVLVGTDTVGGSWSVNGANLNISATAGDKTVSETAIISGDQILVKGSPARRLQ